MILLSVIIPTFQRGGEIEGKLNAYLLALTQGAKKTNTNFECIVIDDHSADGTFDFLKKFAVQCPNLRCIQMQSNVGPGLARDAGVKIALGRWIWFLDDDDVLDAGHVTSLFSMIKEASNSVDLISHSLKHIYKDSAVLTRLNLAKRIISYHEHQEVFRYIIRKSLLTENEIHFSPGLHEDIRYVVELLLRSSSVLTYSKTVVHKQKTDHAITAHMTIDRIDGYINAYNETSLLIEGSEWGTRMQLQQFLVQTLGVILLLITRESDRIKATKFLNYLSGYCTHSKSILSQDLKRLPFFGLTDTNFEYASTVWRTGIDMQDDSLLDAIAEVFNTRLSCKDLDSSIFLGPDEIRACCKRFFIGGIRKGDVVLINADPDINLDKIQAAKQDLINSMNVGSATECSGCPYIERRPFYKGGIDYISLENFAYCNMRCSYCSPKYYGGTEAKYNSAAIVAQAIQQHGGLEDDYHVVWGGGEPTLSPYFENINISLSATSKSGKIRVLSNSLRYSSNLASSLRDKRFHLVTSIDAGTETTFLKVRGKRGLLDVIDNLISYQKELDDPRRITIKYILGPNNYNTDELREFASLIADASLLNCLFQVSCDFTLDAPGDNLVCALYELALRLLNQGAKCVFFDDLVRDRVRMTPMRMTSVLKHLASLRIPTDFLWTPESEENLVLWGAGKQAQWLTQHTASGQSGLILKIIKNVDEYQEFIGQSSHFPLILPAGVQSMYDIINNIERSGFGDRLTRGVLL